MVTRKWWLLVTAALLLLGLTGCKKDKKEEAKFPVLKELEGTFLLETTVKNPDGQSGSSYIQVLSNLSGEPELTTGIQVEMGAPVTVVGDDVYVLPGFAGPSTALVKYHRDGLKLTKVSELQLPPMGTGSLTSVGGDKAYLMMYLLGRIWVIDTKRMEKLSEIDLVEYAHGDKSPEPSVGFVRDGFFYLPLCQGGSDYLPYADYRQVDVLVLDIATDKVVKKISETTSGLCFPTRPVFDGLMFTDENKDLWFSCTGYFGYNPEYLKNGFVCIPHDTQDFDTSKTWDISTTQVGGTNYKAATVYNCDYIGNGKVAAQIGILELGGNPLTARNAGACIVDLKAKTIERLADIPYSNGHSGALLRWKGKMYFTSGGENAAGIWEYDPATGKVTHVLNTTADIGKIHAF